MVAVKSTLEKADVEQILAHYDVGVIEDVKAFTTGTVQTNILTPHNAWEICIEILRAQ